MRPSISGKLCVILCSSAMALTPTLSIAQNYQGDYAAQRNAQAGQDQYRDQSRRSSGSGKKVGGCIGGAIVGGILGALVANAAGGNNTTQNRAAAAGAAAGCAVGWQIGKNWSQRDRQAFDNATQDAFDAPTPIQRDWQAPESREQVTLVTTQPVVENRQVEFEYDSQVAKPAAGTVVVSRPYRATTVLRLRSTPDEVVQDNIIGRFDEGEIVEVVGQTPDGRWAMIGEDGVIVGYAAMSYLTTMDSAQTLRRTRTARAKPERPAPSTQPGRTQTVTNTTTAKPAPRKVQTTKVMASTQCKSMVATSGGVRDQKKGCSLPNGKWQFA
jgi:hypothetical protein